MQILFGMIYVTMSSINSMSDKLANKKDVVEQYLGPLKKEIDEWKQREDKAKSTGAYG
jgi:phage shock protein A